jgi:hypothetical protein
MIVEISDDNVLAEIAAPSIKKRKLSKSAYNIDNFPLPNFSEDVLKILDEDRVLANTQQFIKEASLHLITVIEKPTRCDYDTYVAALMIKHPSIDAEIYVDPALKIQVAY